MKNNKKSRLLSVTSAVLLGAFLLSPFLGKFNFSGGTSVAATSLSKVYLPLVMRNFPFQTVFGVAMDPITTGGGLDQMAAANISWTRPTGVVWSSVETTQGTYNWSVLAGLETELQNASSKGIQVVLLVHTTPEWARKTAGTGPSCGAIAANKLAAFGDFMHALVVRYSVAPYNVKYWEMWNEEDIDPSLVSVDSPYGCWGDQNDAYYGGGYYAEMLKAVYPKIKTADPRAQVLVGGLLLDCDPRGTPSVCASLTPPHDAKPAKFLEGILVGGGGPYFDGVSFHAYDMYWGALGQYGIQNWSSAWNTTGPTVVAKAGFVKSVLTAYGFSEKYLMNTEAAVLCPSCSSNDSTFETTKAYYVAQDYAAAIAMRLRANIWYNVFGWRNSGLLNADLSPRPAYTAFQFARSELRDASFVREITDYAGVVKGYEFTRGDRRIWVLWSLDGGTHTINLSSVPEAAWDALGVSVTPAVSMHVTLNPLYLEWNPQTSSFRF
jgi:hypothetical protein